MFMEYKAPAKYNLYDNSYSIFLAGSIENGMAENWQSLISNYIKLYYGNGHEDNGNYHFSILNPRRDDWDHTQNMIASNPYFNTQVTWELDALNDADLIIFYFDPNTTSPISLLELGIHKDNNIIVCCPEGYFRQGNVEIICKRYNIPFVATMSDLQEYIDHKIEEAIPYYKSVHY